MVFKIKISLVAVSIFLFYSCNRNGGNGIANHRGDSSLNKTKVATIRSNPSNEGDTIYKDENVFVLGKRSVAGDSTINYVGVKFKPHVFFSDFPVHVLTNRKKAAIQYSSNPLAKQFKTVITRTYKNEDVNFAGHYVFAEWGCGSPCHMSALVDVRSGLVYDGIDSSYGYEFKKNSRLLIANPTNAGSFYINCVGCEPLIYVWNEHDKKFVPR